MASQVQGNDSIFERELLQLVSPLHGLSPKPMDEDQDSPGMLRCEIHGGKPD
jgi:hypothetical protein